MPVSMRKELHTPAQIAGAVLDEIAAHPRNFEMEQWTTLAPGEELRPGDPIGNYRLCAASWIARVTGWTLVHAYEDTVVYDRWGEEDDEVRLYAERGEERRHISDVAIEALKINPYEAFWMVSEDTARARLRVIAGRA